MSVENGVAAGKAGLVDLAVGVEGISKVTSHCEGVTISYKTREIEGRRFEFPDQCMKCGKSPAAGSVVISGMILSWNARLHLRVAVPICAVCGKKKPKPELVVKYSSGCRSLEFVNHKFQTGFDQLNTQAISSYAEFLERVK